MISVKLDRNLQHSESAATRALIVVSISVAAAIGPPCVGGDERSIPIDVEAEAALHEFVGNGFSISRSEHFVLASDLGPSRLSELGLLDRLESTYARVVRFCRSYRLPIETLPRRLELVCLARPEDYDRLARSMSPSAGATDGFYDYGTRRSYFTNRQVEGRETTESGSAANSRQALVDRAWWIVVRHEGAHQILDHIAPTLARAAPDWLSEGLACVFETAAADDEFDRPINRWRLLDVARTEGSGGTSRFTDVIREEWGTSRLGHAGRAEKYARAWTVVAYLRDERQDAFGRYLHQLAATPRAPLRVAAKRWRQVTAFEAFFGSADTRMETAIATYARHLAHQINSAHGGAP